MNRSRRRHAFGLILALIFVSGLGLVAGLPAGTAGVVDIDRVDLVAESADRGAARAAGLQRLDASYPAALLPALWLGVGRDELAPVSLGPTTTSPPPQPTQPPGPTRAPSPTAGPRPDPSEARGFRSYKSGPIQITEDGRFIWTAHPHADTVSRIDTRDLSVRHFPLPDLVQNGEPIRHKVHGISVKNDGSQVWVVAHDSDKVYVLDGESGAILHDIDMPYGSGPYSIALSPPGPDGGQPWALVALHRAATAVVINTATREVRPLGVMYRSPLGIAWTDERGEAYVTHLHPEGEHPRISRVMVTEARASVTSQLRIGAAPPRNASGLTQEDAWKNIPEGGYLNFRGHPSLLPRETGKRQIWIPTQYHNMHNDTPSPDSIIQASIRRLDLDSKRLSPDDKVVLTAVQVHDPTQGDNNPAWLGHGWNATISGLVDIGFTRLGERTYTVALAEQSEEIVVFPWDIAPFKSKTSADVPGLPELRVGARPMGLVMAPNLALAYTLNTYDFNISVVDLSDPAAPKEVSKVELAPPDNDDPLAKRTVLRGAKHFYSSNDPRISVNQKVSCASCHINGEHDGRTWNLEFLPPGTHGQRHGPRNVQSLRGLYLSFPKTGERDPDYGWGQLHHSGDRDEIQDFEHTFQGPQMGGTGFIGESVHPELGEPNAGRSIELDAMAAYILELDPLWRSPAREADGSLSESSVRGATFFMGDDPEDHPADADCASCHRPETAFVDFEFHDVGGRGEGNERELNDPELRGECLWCVNTLSLIGVWDTSPFDGIAGYVGSMRGVMEDFATTERRAPHGHTRSLTATQRRDLADFVSSIDGNTTAEEVVSARDTEPPRIRWASPTSAKRVEVWFSEAVDREAIVNDDSFRVERVSDGQNIPVRDVEFDPQNGDRVTLHLDLPVACEAVPYRVIPRAGVRDLADRASGGVANEMDYGLERNRFRFDLPPTLSIELGASGYENLTIPVHDAGMVGPGLSTWSHDGPWLSSWNGNLNVGFVRFEWQEAFMAATGVVETESIREARFDLWPEHGDAQRVEIRRTLQRWSDPPTGGYWNRSADGAPTWRDHSHPDGRWNQAGARALGSTGDRPEDYDGEWDLTAEADAVVEMPSINTPTRFEGPRVTGAFRFWFENPAQDYGYALRLQSREGDYPEASIRNWEYEDHGYGPVLRLTYRLPGTEDCP